MFSRKTFSVVVLLCAAFSLAGCPVKTVVDYAIEARSADDISKDNGIVFDVNKIMADLQTISASTEIYEQRLLVTGIFEDQAIYDDFKSQVEAVVGVKKLYWHAVAMSEEEQEAQNLLSWDDVLVLDSRVGLGLIETKAVADVNFRVAADSFGVVYLLGRARSQEELDKALEVARETKGAKKVVNYVEVRP